MRLIDKDVIPWDVEGVGEIPVITKEEIDEMPTVDAEPVIRCKDCRWFLPSEGKSSGWCSFSQHGYPKADDYCSDAERKEE